MRAASLANEECTFSLILHVKWFWRWDRESKSLTMSPDLAEITSILNTYIQDIEYTAETFDYPPVTKSKKVLRGQGVSQPVLPTCV